MTSPDRIAELKIRVRKAEEQVTTKYVKFAPTTLEEVMKNPKSYFEMLSNDLRNLIVAYQSYVKDLEQFIPL